MKKSDVINKIIQKQQPKNQQGKAFAPTNIALCKYWGKRNQELNLPVTSSLSISLGKKGATTEIKLINAPDDLFFLNDQSITLISSFGKRLSEFLAHFRATPDMRFQVVMHANIPISSGLASSACGFAALVMALDDLFGWNLSKKELSILARLGSGSAARSLWQGFVEWQVGTAEDGMDSHGVSLRQTWEDLCVGLYLISDKEKKISSRHAMQCTIETSSLYSAWPKKVSEDLIQIKKAISEENFELMGKTAESNAMTMHATMASAWPPIVYSLEKTLAAMQKIWKLREEGLPIFFTQDAGPNLKLLFLKKDSKIIQSHFEELEIIQPFER